MFNVRTLATRSSQGGADGEQRSGFPTLPWAFPAEERGAPFRRALGDTVPTPHPRPGRPYKQNPDSAETGYREGAPAAATPARTAASPGDRPGLSTYLGTALRPQRRASLPATPAIALPGAWRSSVGGAGLGGAGAGPGWGRECGRGASRRRGGAGTQRGGAGARGRG